MSDAIVLDVETTGFSPQENRVIEIAIVAFTTGDVLFHSHINPEQVISEEITKLTGITNEMVANAPKFRDVGGRIAMHVREAPVVIGHNPWFDRGMISAEFVRNGIIVQWPTLICTKRTWDVYEPRESRDLQNAFKRFVDKEGFEGAHGALADTLATRRVLHSQIETFNLKDKTWEEFDPEQKKWLGPSNHILLLDGILVLNFGKNKGTPCHKIEKSFWKWLVDKDFPEHVKKLGDFMVYVARAGITGEELASWASTKLL